MNTKGKVTIHAEGQKFHFDLENVSARQFTPVERVRHTGSLIVEKKYGDPVFIMTSNLPEDIREEIFKIVRIYCGC